MAESAVPSRIILRLSERADAWLESHIGLLATLALVAGFIVRVIVARGPYLIGDEALDYLLVNQGSALEAYRASLTNAHPPLYYFVLFYWRFQMSQFDCGKYEMARTRGYEWMFTSENFAPILARMEKQFGWRRGQPIWLAQVAEMRLDAAVLARFGADPNKEFGQNISVTRLRAP